jgi:hypothetical protein
LALSSAAVSGLLAAAFYVRRGLHPWIFAQRFSRQLMRADLGLGIESIGSRSPEFLRNPSAPFRACCAGVLREGGTSIRRRVIHGPATPWAFVKRLRNSVVAKFFGNFVGNFRDLGSEQQKLQTKNQTKRKDTTQMKTLNLNTCRILFASCLSALCLIALSTQAATITVTNTNDSGAGSLRQAIADANDGDTVKFGVSGTITLTTDQLLVEKSINISGPGSNNLAVDGNDASRAFYIGWGRTVTISGLAITNGHAVDGGGIWNNHGTLTINNSTLSGNSATNGGCILNDGAGGLGGSATLTINNSTLNGNSAYYGGVIFNKGLFGSATITINNSTLSGNSATSFGGGIYNFGDYGSAILTINSSTLSGNSTDFIGGAICNHGFSGSATLTISNSTLSGNSANSGAGVYNAGFSGSVMLTISNSTLSGNSASSVGGGIFNEGNSSGSATLAIFNSTLSGNSSTYSGGGIYNYGSSGSATLEIGNTVLKTGASGENIFNLDGTVSSDGYNLSSDNAGGFLAVTGDQITTDPMLGPLQDNGGPTFTHALSQGSPAVDAGDPNFTPSPDYDQRGPGYVRIAHGRVDIGAFEVQIVMPSYAGQVQPPINADGSSNFNVRRGVVPMRFNLTLGGVATCDLPSATIAVTRTAGGVIGQVNESDYSGNADTGSNFRISSCQYVYNLNARALGVGTYRVEILINGQVVGSATFGLN